MKKIKDTKDWRAKETKDTNRMILVDLKQNQSKYLETEKSLLQIRYFVDRQRDNELQDRAGGKGVQKC